MFCRLQRGSVSSHPLKGIRVLIAEDQMIVAIELEDMLQEAGCEVIGPATTLESAMDLANRTTPDAAVLDVNLDGTRSYALAEMLQARGIPVILATGYGASRLPERWQQVPRLEKPFTGTGLQALLARVMEGAGQG